MKRELKALAAVLILAGIVAVGVVGLGVIGTAIAAIYLWGRDTFGQPWETFVGVPLLVVAVAAYIIARWTRNR